MADDLREISPLFGLHGELWLTCAPQEFDWLVFLSFGLYVKSLPQKEPHSGRTGIKRSKTK